MAERDKKKNTSKEVRDRPAGVIRGSVDSGTGTSRGRTISSSSSSSRSIGNVSAACKDVILASNSSCKQGTAHVTAVCVWCQQHCMVTQQGARSPSVKQPAQCSCHISTLRTCLLLVQLCAVCPAAALPPHPQTLFADPQPCLFHFHPLVSTPRRRRQR
jgi:hypothetical protein